MLAGGAGGGVCCPGHASAGAPRRGSSSGSGCFPALSWRGRAVGLAGCLLKQENEEKCHEALFCCTEGLERCCAAVIQWGKDKSLTYTYAPPRERTPWAEKEQNMKYEFPRAAREEWLSRALPLAALCSLRRRSAPGPGCSPCPIARTCSLGEGRVPFSQGLGLRFPPEETGRGCCPSPCQLAAPAGSSPRAEGGGGGGSHDGEAWETLT